MKRFHTGLVVFDKIDVIFLSFSAGSGIAFLIRKYKKYKNRSGEDLLVMELKKQSPIVMLSKNGKPLKLPLVRGGNTLKKFSLLIKNKKLAILVSAIFNIKTKQKQLKLLQLCLFALNSLLTTSVGLRFAVGGSLSYTHFILIAFPSTVGGLIVGLAIANPLASVLLPLGMLYGRGIEDIADPYEKCKAICKVAEQFHNKQLILEMQKLNSLVEDTSIVLQLPIDKVPLLCVEEKLSLVQRFKLTQLIKSQKARKRVQHFSKFIQKFPECDADPKAVYEQIVETIAE